MALVRPGHSGNVACTIAAQLPWHWLPCRLPLCAITPVTPAYCGPPLSMPTDGSHRQSESTGQPLSGWPIAESGRSPANAASTNRHIQAGAQPGRQPVSTKSKWGQPMTLDELNERLHPIMQQVLANQAVMPLQAYATPEVQGRLKEANDALLREAIAIADAYFGVTR
jgi:hypothetical protein